MVVTHPVSGKQISIGVSFPYVERLKPTLELLETDGCDFVVAPIVHTRYAAALKGGKSPFLDAKSTDALQPLCRSESELTSKEWKTAIIGRVSPWLRLDSPIDKVRQFSEWSLDREVSFANYLSMQAIVIDIPDANAVTISNFARVVCCTLNRYPFMQILIKVGLGSLTLPGSAAGSTVDGSRESNDSQDMVAESELEHASSAWLKWEFVRSFSGNHPNLGLMLEMSSELPTKAVLERWLAEFVYVFLINKNAFVPNKLGYPVLSKRHQDFLKAMFKYQPLFCISDEPNVKIDKDGGANKLYVQYLAHLFGKQPPEGDAEQIREIFHDYLQPLGKPFRTNLEAQRFDFQEADAVKFGKYADAIKLYLSEHRAADQTVMVIVVLGGGRGGMVRVVNECLTEYERKAKIIVLERNSNTLVSLQNMKVELGWTNVNIVYGDPRDWESAVRVDLVVSEMIGAMGDNEMLPEYVEGISRYFKEDTVVIPSNITTYVAPITSPKLYSEVCLIGDEGVSAFDCPYVVAMHRALQIAAVQACFDFSLPNLADASTGLTMSQSEQTQCVEFGVLESTRLHGFGAYFEARLYKDIGISTVPGTHTHGMHSWLSVLFPLRSAPLLPAESICQAQFWRRQDGDKVWYEWSLLSPVVLPVQNANGSAFSVSI
ncbi:Protein arginine N-methyltransferase 5 [Porphyridium purpureum]|uniref:Protein arginine N-methyltransferase n=1 Tax=Porphyridium purpureum TaxID=35688 RepID=A0A5J4Z4U6_PORPP|nr:Protein arginine N-methyltransferase 5 [Porphyridium purpureum]|eukprot:POR2495..scf295_1